MNIAEMFDPIQEGLSKILYHRTELDNALNILKTNEFKLTPNLGTSSDQLHKEVYYLSTSRTPGNEYNFVSKDTEWAALLKLDGDKLAQRFKGNPVDYWGQLKRRSEAEDRVVSKNPKIPNARDYILEIHFMVIPESKHMGGSKMEWYRLQLYKTAKQLEIPVFVYNNPKDFKLLNKPNAIPYKPVFKIEEPKFSARYPRKPFQIWWEFITAKSEKDLSKMAYRRLNYKGDFVTQFMADIHNYKKDADYRDSMDTLIKKLRSLGIKNADEFYEWVYKKFEQE